MSEPLPEPRPPETMHGPRDSELAAEHELARKNMAFGWALFALALALFAGSVIVAFIYLAVGD